MKASSNPVSGDATNWLATTRLLTTATIALVILTLMGILASGCRLTSPNMVTCPLPIPQQVQAVLKIVPIGTPREDAIQRLEREGIRGNFGQTTSIFYCDLWERPEKTLWHINVALLFDDSGKLYATRPDGSGQVSRTPKDDATSPDSEALGAAGSSRKS